MSEGGTTKRAVKQTAKQATSGEEAPRIDCLQYANWSEKIFRQMNAGGVHAAHVTIAYHENFREAVSNVIAWQRRFQKYRALIFHGKTAADVKTAQAQGRTAIFFGMQTPAVIEDDIGLVRVWHDLGARFMQLTYNNQSLLAGGCYEPHDSGVSRFGREVIGEMNRAGMAVDLSHAGARSVLQAIELSARPVAITHANPKWWHDCARNQPHDALRALAKSGGMLGLSLYAHHLRGGGDCTLAGFCEMAAETAARYGTAFLGIGSDLCQDQPHEVVAWMRNGRWRAPQADDAAAVFPRQPAWFENNLGFDNIAAGLKKVGFQASEVSAIMGGNWLRFFQESFDRRPGEAEE